MTSANDVRVGSALTDALGDRVPGLKEAWARDVARMAKQEARGILRQWEALPNADALFAALLAKPDSIMRGALEKIEDKTNPITTAFKLVEAEQHFANRVMFSEAARLKGKFPPAERLPAARAAVAQGKRDPLARDDTAQGL